MQQNIDYKNIIGRTSPKENIKIFPYDFRRPDKFSLDQIRTLSIMHDTFSRLISTLISARLRRLTHIHIKSVDQCTYEEFIRSAVNPSTFAIINMDPLKCSAVFNIEPFISFSMITRLLGSNCEEPVFNRDLTNIEQAVIEQVFLDFLRVLRESWSTVIDLRPRLSHIEMYPMFVQIVPPPEMVVLITMECRINDVSGMINFCIPYLTLEPIFERLTAKYWFSSVRKKGDHNTPEISGLQTDSEILYEGEDIVLKDLSGIKRNKLIRLPGYRQGKAYLRAGGKRVAELEHETGNRRKQYVFKVLTDNRAADEVDELLGPVTKQKDSVEAERIEKLIDTPIRKLAGEIHNTMEKLNVSIQQVNKRQDEIVDQLYFNMPDREIPEEDKNSFTRKRPFLFIESVDAELLFTMLCQEHPQTIALVLSYLDAGISALFISKLPEVLQSDVIKRIALIDRTSPDILEEVESVIEKKLKDASVAKDLAAGGITAVRDILGITSRNVEKNIIKALEKQNPELAEKIKSIMFVFEDMALLDKKTIQIILKHVDKQDLLMAMKAVDDTIKEHIFESMTATDTAEAKKAFNDLGAVRLRDVEAAQKRIVNIINELDEAGVIIVARKEDLV